MGQSDRLPKRPFRAIIFDWDGTAVATRQEDASALDALIRALLARGAWIVVVTGTNFQNIDRQLGRTLDSVDRSRLLVCTNRGSEVYGFDRQGRTVRRWLRTATPKEELQLTKIAESLRDEVSAATGLDIAIVANRLNRRKVDLIPLPEWADPPKAQLGDLLAAVEKRLHEAGYTGGLGTVVSLARDEAERHGLPGARITSDVKNIEIGLTDKGDAIDWVKQNVLAPHGIAMRDVLVAGDEFGTIAGIPGSDDRMREQIGPEALVVSVGPEPEGVPAGVIHLGGGPLRFRELLAEQIKLREAVDEAGSDAQATASPRLPDRGRSHRVSDSDWLDQACSAPDDPTWTMRDVGYRPTVEHEVESRLAISNGLLGIRASLDWPTSASLPRTYIAGLFETPDQPQAVPALVAAPDVLAVGVTLNDSLLTAGDEKTRYLARTLDLRRGVLLGDWEYVDGDGGIVRVRTLRFASHALRAVAGLLGRIEVPASREAVLTMGCDSPATSIVPEQSGPHTTVWRTKRQNRLFAVAAQGAVERADKPLPPIGGDTSNSQWSWRTDGRPVTLSRIVAVSRDMDDPDPPTRANEILHRSRRMGMRRLVAAHARAWQRRWEASDILIEGDAAVQCALRFALYHLNSAANPEDERVSIGARALTGDGYLGHVFWDTELYVLPFFTYTWPEAARALLMYRFHTLPAARAKAHRLGFRGALYAWESTDTGEETTPNQVIGPDGQVIPVRSGELEQHISADIAYAVWRYWDVTRDASFLRDAGAEIILETARFWASRVRLGSDGLFHIDGVIGPDEYHEAVDDNAFTNVMAQWNLERGAEIASMLQRRWPDRWAELVAKLHIEPGEAATWSATAAKMYTGFDPETGVFEQFAGYSKLEPIDLTAYEPRTVPIDLLLGRDRVQRSQAIKQADVVMLLDLLEARFPESVRRANFDYYEPRCGQGSSLSPPIHALVAARLGKVSLAKRYVDQTVAIDLGNSMGNAAHGVHIAAMGGLWQSVVFGFAGLRCSPDGLAFDPHLPRDWTAIRFPVRWRGRLVRIAVEQRPPMFCATLERGKPMKIEVGGASCELRSGLTWCCSVEASRDLERGNCHE